LKSPGSAGIAIEGPSREFERLEPLLDWTGQPVRNCIVRIGQAGDGKSRAIYPEGLRLIVCWRAHLHWFTGSLAGWGTPVVWQ
jgi:hypothetical protein